MFLRARKRIRSLPGEWYDRGVRVPVWVTLGIAIIVIVFGLYRIRLSLKGQPKPGDDASEKRGVMGGGFYRMSPRVHLFIGIMYLALGGCLVATSFGWNPLGGMIGNKTEAPADKNAAPTKGSGGVPVDVIKPTK